MRRSLAASLAIFALVAGAPRIALAQAPQSGSDEAKSKAKEHFDRGNQLLSEGDEQGALAEFLLSRELYATRGNTLNAAVVLRRLGRYDEALTMFEQLLAEFSDMDPNELRDVQNEIEVLKTRIGRLEIRSEDGATVYVDNRERGTTPLAEPLGISAGSRVVRVVKPGRLPFERRIEIAGEQRLVLNVELKPIVASVPEGERERPAAQPERRPAPVVVPAQPRARPFVALEASGLIAPTLGGELAARCEGECSAALPLGASAFASAGVALGSGLDVGAELGVLSVIAGYEKRPDPISPVGFSGTGRAEDDLTFNAIALGGTVAIRTGDTAPISFGLGMGVLAASVRDERSGVYTVDKLTPPSETRTIAVDAEQSVRGWYAYAKPELRFGFELSDRLELTLGAELMLLLALSEPSWDRETAVVSELGFTQHAADTLTGSVLVFVLPGAGARYVF